MQRAPPAHEVKIGNLMVEVGKLTAQPSLNTLAHRVEVASRELAKCERRIHESNMAILRDPRNWEGVGMGEWPGDADIVLVSGTENVSPVWSSGDGLEIRCIPYEKGNGTMQTVFVGNPSDGGKGVLWHSRKQEDCSEEIESTFFEEGDRTKTAGAIRYSTVYMALSDGSIMQLNEDSANDFVMPDPLLAQRCGVMSPESRLNVFQASSDGAALVVAVWDRPHDEFNDAALDKESARSLFNMSFNARVMGICRAGSSAGTLPARMQGWVGEAKPPQPFVARVHVEYGLLSDHGRECLDQWSVVLDEYMDLSRGRGAMCTGALGKIRDYVEKIAVAGKLPTDVEDVLRDAEKAAPRAGDSGGLRRDISRGLLFPLDSDENGVQPENGLRIGAFDVGWFTFHELPESMRTLAASCVGFVAVNKIQETYVRATFSPSPSTGNSIVAVKKGNEERFSQFAQNSWKDSVTKDKKGHDILKYDPVKMNVEDLSRVAAHYALQQRPSDGHKAFKILQAEIVSKVNMRHVSVRVAWALGGQDTTTTVTHILLWRGLQPKKPCTEPGEEATV